ncbi:MAG: formate dehydrogenase [Pseudomonadota bacterium]
MAKADKVERAVADRRGFLKLVGLGAASGGAAIAAGTGVAQAAPAEPAEDGSYSETAHVRTYYDLAQF